MDDYIIVGAGVFGASTALSLIEQNPSSSVTLIDPSTKCGASWDWNKIIRADYHDVLYTHLALEAMEMWIANPLYNKYYHKTATCWISQTSPDVYIKNYQQLRVERHFEVLEVEKAKEYFNGLFENADFGDVQEVFLNHDSGWVEAAPAVENVVNAAVAKGVKLVTVRVAAVVLSDDGNSCKGVRTETGEIMCARNTILCNGAALPKLMADSAPDRDDFRIARALATGLVTALVSSDSDVSKFANAPICVTENALRCGFIPSLGNNPLKIWSEVTFKNTGCHPSGREISMPPDELDYGQWKVPETLRRHLQYSLKGILGSNYTAITLRDYRICWDLTTPSEDFIISPHPTCQGLYIATAGSLHAFKMLPILGKYVARMLDNRLDEELAKRWAWDREVSDPAGRGLYPKLELRDLATSGL